MIAYLEGTLTLKNPAFVYIDIGGIAYQVHISLFTYEKISALDKCKLFTSLIVREDSQTLYGFFDEEEKLLFNQLIAVSGIGPNTARVLLSSVSPNELKNAIIHNDVSLIKSVKGIGTKTAERLIIELRDTIKKHSDTSGLYSPQQITVKSEAVSALVTLGFTKIMAGKTIDKVYQQFNNGEPSVEDLVKQALKVL